MKVKLERIAKFFLVGGTGAALNLGAMVFLIELVGFRGYILKNLANILSMELSIIYAFIGNRFWTWKDVPKKAGKKLAVQFSLFHISVLAGVLMRICLFALLEFCNVDYILNVIIGIGLAAGLDFILYDKVVFKQEGIKVTKIV